jgi:hypothetical protein
MYEASFTGMKTSQYAATMHQRLPQPPFGPYTRIGLFLIGPPNFLPGFACQPCVSGDYHVTRVRSAKLGNFAKPPIHLG